MLRILQRQVTEWADGNFGNVPTWMPLMGVVEELGELSEADLAQIPQYDSNGNVAKWVRQQNLLKEMYRIIGRLCHAHLKESQGIRQQEDHREKAKDAIGDIVIYLAHYCSVRGFDFEEIVDQTWQKVGKRDWKKNSESGQV